MFWTKHCAHPLSHARHITHTHTHKHKHTHTHTHTHKHKKKKKKKIAKVFSHPWREHFEPGRAYELRQDCSFANGTDALDIAFDVTPRSGVRQFGSVCGNYVGDRLVLFFVEVDVDFE
jgi:rRNA maturation protein Rpf1